MNITYFISDDLCNIFKWLVFTTMCMAISVFGVVTNIINIICFVKQGFKDPVNVSLLGLAVSDVGCLATLIWTNIFVTPAVSSADLPFDAVDFQYLTSAWPHATFSCITSWITAMITLERCLCITIPLKVKNLVTPSRVLIVIIIIYLLLISAMAPIYVVNRLDWKYFPERNKTLIGLVIRQDKRSIEKVSFAINNVFVPSTAFTIIIVSTLMLVIKLHKTTKWRKMSIVQAKDSNFSRNQKVAKMVVMIATLFISCYIPFSVIIIGVLLEPELSVHGKYKNTTLLFIGGGMILESVNSSANIFIYHHMSSRYRLVFRQLLCLDSNKQMSAAALGN